MSWDSPESRLHRQEMSNLAQPEAPQDPTPPATPTPPPIPTPPAAATPVIPAQEDVVMEEAPVADNGQPQFIFPLIGIIALIWLRQLLATLVAAVVAPTQSRYYRIKDVEFVPHPECVMACGSPVDSWTLSFKLKVEKTILKAQMLYRRIPESLRRFNVVMSSLNCNNLPPIGIEVFENIIRWTLGRLRNPMAGGEHFYHVKTPPKLLNLLNRLFRRFNGNEAEMVTYIATVLYRNIPVIVKRFMHHARRGGNFTFEFINRLHDLDNLNEIGIYGDLALKGVEDQEVGDQEIDDSSEVEIDGFYGGKTKIFKDRWEHYLQRSTVAPNMHVGVHFGVFGRNWKRLCRLVQLLIWNLDDEAFQKDGAYCEDYVEEWTILAEGVISAIMRCFGWDLGLLEASDNVDARTQCPWVGLNFVDQIFDVFSHKDLTSEERRIIAKEREEKLGMPFMAAYASGVPKKDFIWVRLEGLAQAAYSKAVTRIQALCGDGTSVLGQKNHNKAPELSTIRGKMNLFLFDFAMENGRIFSGDTNASNGKLKAGRCSFEALVPNTATGYNQSYEIKVEFNNPNRTLYHAHVYTGHGGSNAEKNAAAFAEMTRIKALAPNLSIYYRLHAEPGMAAAPWVEFVKDITRNHNSELENFVRRLLQCQSVLDIDVKSLGKGERRIQIEQDLAKNYLINKAAGKFKNRANNVKLAAEYAAQKDAIAIAIASDPSTDKGEGSSTGQKQQKKNQGQEGSKSTVKTGKKKKREDEDSENLTVTEGKKRKEDKEENLEDEDLDDGIVKPDEYGLPEWMDEFGDELMEEAEDELIQELEDELMEE